jgi:predicted SnoaL-like aldol condensation-catalyzing enzyme
MRHRSRDNEKREENMSAEENKQVLLRYVEQLQRGNFAIADEFFSANFRVHSPVFSFPEGIEGARMMVNLLRDSEVTARIEDIIAEGDRVAVRWTITGVYRGEARPGFVPGEKVTTGSIAFYRVVDGKIEEDWGADVVSPKNDPWS